MMKACLPGLIVLLICAGGCLGAATGTLDLTSSPDGAEIYIDGVFRETTPATLDVSEGRHSLELRKEGYAQWSQDITVIAGKKYYLSGTLKVPGQEKPALYSTPTPRTALPTTRATLPPATQGPGLTPNTTPPQESQEITPSTPDEEFLACIQQYSTDMFEYRANIGYYPYSGTSRTSYPLMKKLAPELKKAADHHSSNMTGLKVSKEIAIPHARFIAFLDWYSKAGSALILAADYNDEKDWENRKIWLDGAVNAYQEGDRLYENVIELMELDDIRK
ncbi:MAG: PEGA domain-containing protein [Methanomicrobiaceae archaeon]|nr:PEGA domain-containing protein [Methanomicrobiaceae archaeon]